MEPGGGPDSGGPRRPECGPGGESVKGKRVGGAENRRCRGVPKPGPRPPRRVREGYILAATPPDRPAEPLRPDAFMSVLDRLSSPLRSRDAAVRIRAVQKHPPLDLAPLERLARADPDPRVRREAVRRIESPRSLLAIAETAEDDRTRELARARADSLLVKIAADDRDLAESRRALALLVPPRGIAEVVLRARFPEVQAEAFDRLAGAREANGAEAPGERPPVTEAGENGDAERSEALALVAGKAEDPALRARALGAVATPDSLARVALSGTHRDTALAAVRRIEDADLLLSVAERAASRSVRRSAARRAEDLLPPEHPERVRRREADLAAVLDELEAGGGEAGAAAERLREAEALAASGPVGKASAARLRALRARLTEASAPAADSPRADLLIPDEPAPKPAPPPPPKKPARPAPPEFVALLEQVRDEPDTLSLARLRTADREARALLEGIPEDAPVREEWNAAARAARERAFSRKKEREAAFALAEIADQAESFLAGLTERPNAERPEGARRELARLNRRFAALTRAPAPAGTPMPTGAPDSEDPPAAEDPAVAEDPTVAEHPAAAEDQSAAEDPAAAEDPGDAEEPARTEAAAAPPESGPEPGSPAPGDSEDSPDEAGPADLSAPTGPSAESEDAARFRRAASAIEERLEARERTSRKQVEDRETRLSGLEERLAKLEGAKMLSLPEAEAALRELGTLRNRPADWRALGAERRVRLERLQAALIPRLREARELREWKRWSNLAEQEELIRRAREIESLDDPREIDRELGKLEKQWREVRHTERDRGQALWEEWTALRARLLERVAPLREAAEKRAAEQLEALGRLAERAEEIGGGEDPKRSSEMAALMDEWRENARGLGRKKSEKVWKRFQAANRRYFDAIGEIRKKRRKEFAANIAAREALIARAKALLEETDEKAVHSGVRALMAEWKEAPPVPRSAGDRLWDEFRTACDDARDRRRRARDEASRTAEDPPEAADLLARVEEAAALPPAERPAAAEKIWTEHRRRRKPTPGLRPGPQEEKAERRLAECLGEAYEADPDAFAGTRFDQSLVASRLAGLLSAVEELAGEPKADTGAESAAEMLQRRLGAGRAADRDAPAREAAREAAVLRERARAAGFALAPPAVETLTRIEEVTGRLIAAAPTPAPSGARPRGRERPKGRPRARRPKAT